jgi:hypothetical protein
MASAVLLQGCATDSIGTSKAALCAPWKPISYSSKQDTARTVRQVRAHNLTGKNVGCWT